jgi:hypothetical protein
MQHASCLSLLGTTHHSPLKHRPTTVKDSDKDKQSKAITKKKEQKNRRTWCFCTAVPPKWRGIRQQYYPIWRNGALHHYADYASHEKSLSLNFWHFGFLAICINKCAMIFLDSFVLCYYLLYSTADPTQFK